MRRGIIEHVAKGGAGLDPLTLAALKALKPVQTAPTPAAAAT